MVAKCFPVFDKYQEKWGFKVFPQYKLNLTLYGLGGCFNCQNREVTILIKDKDGFVKDPATMIVHEMVGYSDRKMVHIGIEETIVNNEEYNRNRDKIIII